MNYLIFLLLIVQILFFAFLIVYGFINRSQSLVKSPKLIYYLLLEGITSFFKANRILDVFSTQVSQLHLKLFKLRGPTHTQIDTLTHIAKLFAFVEIIVLAFTSLALVQQDPLVVLVGSLLASAVVIYKHLNLDNQLVKRKREIIAELPFILNSLVLLLNAGEPLNNAFLRVLKTYRMQDSSNFTRELLSTLTQLENGVSFIEALENLNQRLAVQEIAILTSTLILNTRRGNKELGLILENLANEFWSRRLNEARIVGEEASAKLIFPMILIFLVVVLVVATPAILIF